MIYLLFNNKVALSVNDKSIEMFVCRCCAGAWCPGQRSNGSGGPYIHIYISLLFFLLVSFVRNPQARGLLLIIGVGSSAIDLDRRCNTLYGVWNGIGRGISCTLIHAKKIHGVVVYGKWEITLDRNAGTNIQK